MHAHAHGCTSSFVWTIAPPPPAHTRSRTYTHAPPLAWQASLTRLHMDTCGKRAELQERLEGAMNGPGKCKVEEEEGGMMELGSVVAAVATAAAVASHQPGLALAGRSRGSSSSSSSSGDEDSVDWAEACLASGLAGGGCGSGGGGGGSGGEWPRPGIHVPDFEINS